VRYEEVFAGDAHALRFGAANAQYLHLAGAPPGVQRPVPSIRRWASFRLKQGVDISGFGRNVQIILRAEKYGMFLADNGRSWFLSGAPDPRWDDDELHRRPATRAISKRWTSRR
jgi:hypothetical protein